MAGVAMDERSMPGESAGRSGALALWGARAPRPTAETGPRAGPPGGEARPARGGLGLPRAPARDPQLERERAVDELRERRRRRRFEAGALDRAREQLHGLERLDGLAEPLRDLGRGH